MGYVRYKLPDKTHEILKTVSKRIGMKESEISRLALMEYLKSIGVLSERMKRRIRIWTYGFKTCSQNKIKGDAFWMKIIVEAEAIPFDSDEEIDDIFVGKQYSKSYFQRQGKKVLLGDNFESNILLDINFGKYDIYNILKRGKTKKDKEIEDYNNILRLNIKKEKKN